MITVYELGPSDIQKILANYFGAEIAGVKVGVKVGVQDRYRYTDEEGYSEAFANVIIRKGLEE